MEFIPLIFGYLKFKPSHLCLVFLFQLGAFQQKALVDLLKLSAFWLDPVPFAK